MSRRAKCFKTGKDSFPNPLEANIEMARIELVVNHKHRHREFRGEIPKQSYRCEFCRQWHLTSQSKGEGRGNESPGN